MVFNFLMKKNKYTIYCKFVNCFLLFCSFLRFVLDLNAFCFASVVLLSTNLTRLLGSVIMVDKGTPDNAVLSASTEWNLVSASLKCPTKLEFGKWTGSCSSGFVPLNVWFQLSCFLRWLKIVHSILKYNFFFRRNDDRDCNKY